jgi:nicotinamide-nucleotide amidase
MKPLRADILAIGSELLHGGRVDSNSLFIGDMLAHCGIRVSKKMVLSDEQTDIQAALKASSKKVDVVVLTGGLGSTVDDRTREAVATAFGRPLGVRRKALQILNRQVQSRGRMVTPLLAKQALIPSGATVLDNLLGTAPGFYLQEGTAHVFAIPGVPREAREMLEFQVHPILKRKLRATVFLWSHAFNTTGLPETDIQQRLASLIKKSSAITLSLLASTKGVKVTLSCWRPANKKSTKTKTAELFPEGDILIRQVRKALEPWLFSEGEQNMEEVVGQLCSLHKWDLALAESCTGGLIAHRLTEVPGSSTYLDRGVVIYSNKAKQELLGVSPAILRKYGAVSAQVAEAMAKGIRVKSQVDLGVSVTGIAGPGGGSAKKPVGLVYMAIDGPHGGQSQRCRFWGNRTEIKFRSSQAVLDMIRRYILQTKG